jgi:hypothetical protein
MGIHHYTRAPGDYIDQVQLALLVLQCMNDLDIEIILVPEEDGISLAFNFKSILGDYGEEIIEIEMDSTCKKSLVLLLDDLKCSLRCLDRENKCAWL